jgi:hypothetical protein
VFRTILGGSLLIAGWFLGHSILLMVLGGLVIFSGFYDRCPILNALAPRVKSIFHRPI